jgi:hypothetical protein
MIWDPEFGHEHYDFNLNQDVIQDAVAILSGYVEKLRDGKTDDDYVRHQEGWDYE